MLYDSIMFSGHLFNLCMLIILQDNTNKLSHILELCIVTTLSLMLLSPIRPLVESLASISLIARI